MKRYNNVKILRGPKGNKIGRNLSAIRCSYDEMLPGPDEGDDLFSIELYPIGTHPNSTALIYEYLLVSNLRIKNCTTFEPIN